MAGKSFKQQLNPTFKAPVDIPRIGGDPLRVTFTFKTMDRVALAKTFDKWKKEAEAMLERMRVAAENDEPWSLELLAENEITLQVSQLKDVVEGWGFSEEFNDENIELVVASTVSVTDAIIAQYHEAYNRARVGN